MMPKALLYLYIHFAFCHTIIYLFCVMTTFPHFLVSLVACFVEGSLLGEEVLRYIFHAFVFLPCGNPGFPNETSSIVDVSLMNLQVAWAIGH